jgi:hypothetical protein
MSTSGQMQAAMMPAVGAAFSVSSVAVVVDIS